MPDAVALLASALAAGMTAGWWTWHELARLPAADERAALWRRRLGDRRGVLILASSSAAFGVLITARFGTRLETLGYLWLVIVSGPLSAVDLAARRLPRRIVWPSYVVVVVLLTLDAVARHDIASLSRAAVAAISVAGVFGALAFTTRSLGLGDVRLAGLLAFALGYQTWHHVIGGFLLAFILAAVIAVELQLRDRGLHDRRIALGPALLIGALIALVA